MSVESAAILFRHFTDRSNWRKYINVNCFDDYPTRLNTYDEAPSFMKHNPYIRTGYRSHFNARQCVQSIFRWTNETLNIWTHGIGLFIFMYHIMEILSSEEFQGTRLTGTQRTVALYQLTCYCITMGTSCFYHTFCCMSCEAHRKCYMIDVIGIVFGSTANYLNGVYYLFECHPGWRALYLVLTLGVALIILMSAIKSMVYDDPEEEKRRFLSICVWIGAGMLVPVHWMFLNDFKWTSYASIFFPRFLGFYGFTVIAFVFFMWKLPERLCPGSLDYVGHSHQWWHVLSMTALYWWFKSGIVFADYANNHTHCING